MQGLGTARGGEATQGWEGQCRGYSLEEQCHEHAGPHGCGTLAMFSEQIWNTKCLGGLDQCSAAGTSGQGTLFLSSLQFSLPDFLKFLMNILPSYLRDCKELVLVDKQQQLDIKWLINLRGQGANLQQKITN